MIYDEAARDAAKKLFEDGNEDDLFELLSNEGIFVGDNTLELDLIATISDELKETYKELRNSESSSEQFDIAIERAAKDPDLASDVLSRIETIGKGRFAQRLAGKLEGKNPPPFIQAAIEHIINSVNPSNAKPGLGLGSGIDRWSWSDGYDAPTRNQGPGTKGGIHRNRTPHSESGGEI